MEFPNKSRYHKLQLLHPLSYHVSAPLQLQNYSVVNPSQASECFRVILWRNFKMRNELSFKSSDLIIVQGLSS